MAEIALPPDTTFEWQSADDLEFGTPLYMLSAIIKLEETEATPVAKLTFAELMKPEREAQVEVWTPTGRMRHEPSDTTMDDPADRVHQGFESGDMFNIETVERGWKGHLVAADLQGELVLCRDVYIIDTNDGNHAVVGRVLFRPQTVSGMDAIRQAVPNVFPAFAKSPRTDFIRATRGRGLPAHYYNEEQARIASEHHFPRTTARAPPRHVADLVSMLERRPASDVLAGHHASGTPAGLGEHEYLISSFLEPGGRQRRTGRVAHR